MAFVRVDTWQVEPAAALSLPLWLSGRGASRTVALILSLLVDIGLIAALILAGQIDAPNVSAVRRSIAAIDLPSLSQQQAGATKPTPQTALPQTVPVSAVEITKTSPVPAEWSVTALPPLPTPPAPVPQSAPAPSTSVRPTVGSTQTGQATGGGYDPYAFASYRGAGPGRDIAAPQAASSVVSPLPLPAALAQLQAMFRQRLRIAGRQITLRFRVDPAGRITHVEAVEPLPMRVLADASDIAQGFVLCAADPARTIGATAKATFIL